MKKKAAILILIFGHLCVIASGMLHKPLVTSPRLFEVKKYYQMFTAAGASYGFFSPEIANQFLVHFEVEPGHRHLDMADLVSHEVGLRIGNMNRYFLYQYENEAAKRAAAASLSAAVFDLAPDAREVTFVSELYLIPKMQDFAAGQLPTRKEVYRAKFVLPSQAREVSVADQKPH